MLKRAKMLFNNKIWNLITGILFPLILVLFSLMHITEGITVTDTGYNYGNYIFLDSLDDMWKFSTYLANVVGVFFTKLPLGTTLLGLNLYTGIVKAITALAAYYLCVNVCKMSKELVFLGELLALGLCWCPTALLYNYMTYLLFNLSALFIFCAFKTMKNRYFVLAGICLGLNLMVRIPNLAEVALILCVWFGGIVYKKNFKNIVQDTLFCMMGYFLSVGTVLCYIAVRYGMNRYIEGIKALFAMTEDATSYSAMAMITSSIRTYLNYSKWIACLLGIVVIGIIGFAVLNGKLLRLKKVVVYFMVVAYVFLAYNRKQYTLDYRNYSSMFFWGVLFLMVALLTGFMTMFFVKCSKELKLLASLVIVIILITPIGSNNALYSPINNLFLVAPVILYTIQCLPGKEIKAIIKNKFKIYLYPVKAILTGFVAAVFIQSIIFGACFVFRDGNDGEKRNYQVENNEVLAGMKTTKQNAENLQGLNDYLEKKDLKGKEVLLYGNVPAVSFYFEMNPVLSTTWPDLDSFSYTKFQAEMDNLKADISPVVITNPDTAVYLREQENLKNVEGTWKKKVERLYFFLEQNNYEESYSNAGFVVYEIAK